MSLSFLDRMYPNSSVWLKDLCSFELSARVREKERDDAIKIRLHICMLFLAEQKIVLCPQMSHYKEKEEG